MSRNLSNTMSNLYNTRNLSNYDGDYTLTATLPVLLTTENDSTSDISLKGITGLGTASQILKMNAGATALEWSSDVDTTYTATAPLDIAGTTISLKNLSGYGTDGYFLKTNGTDTISWAVPSDTTYTATSPLFLSGTAFTLKDLTGFGSSGQVIKTNSGTDGLEWGEPDVTKATSIGTAAAGSITLGSTSRHLEIQGNSIDIEDADGTTKIYITDEDVKFKGSDVSIQGKATATQPRLYFTNFTNPLVDSWIMIQGVNDDDDSGKYTLQLPQKTDTIAVLGDIHTTAEIRALFSATDPITYNNSTGAIGWTNSNSYITLTSLETAFNFGTNTSSNVTLGKEDNSKSTTIKGDTIGFDQNGSSFSFPSSSGTIATTNDIPSLTTSSNFGTGATGGGVSLGNVSNTTTINSTTCAINGTTTITGGLKINNGQTSAGYIQIFEDEDNGVNAITIQPHAQAYSDYTITLPSSAGQLALEGSIPNLSTTTSYSSSAASDISFGNPTTLRNITMNTGEFLITSLDGDKGDCILKIQADKPEENENSNPEIQLLADGDTTTAKLYLNDNDFHIHHIDNYNIKIGAKNETQLILSHQDVLVNRASLSINGVSPYTPKIYFYDDDKSNFIALQGVVTLGSNPYITLPSTTGTLALLTDISDITTATSVSTAAPSAVTMGTTTRSLDFYSTSARFFSSLSLYRDGADGDTRFEIGADLDTSVSTAHPILTFNQSDINNVSLEIGGSTDANNFALYGLDTGNTYQFGSIGSRLGGNATLLNNFEFGRSNQFDFTSGAGANGDCVVRILADVDNNTETSNPELQFHADNSTTIVKMYLDDNDFYIAHTDTAANLRLGVGTSNLYQLSLDTGDVRLYKADVSISAYATDAYARIFFLAENQASSYTNRIVLISSQKNDSSTTTNPGQFELTLPAETGTLLSSKSSVLCGDSTTTNSIGTSSSPQHLDIYTPEIEVSTLGDTNAFLELRSGTGNASSSYTSKISLYNKNNTKSAFIELNSDNRLALTNNSFTNNQLLLWTYGLRIEGYYTSSTAYPFTMYSSINTTKFLHLFTNSSSSNGWHTSGVGNNFEVLVSQDIKYYNTDLIGDTDTEHGYSKLCLGDIFSEDIFADDVYSDGSQLTSDKRLKKDIKPIENALSTINKLECKTFLKKTKQQDDIWGDMYRQDSGFLAQDLWNDIPELRFIVAGVATDIPENFDASGRLIDDCIGWNVIQDTLDKCEPVNEVIDNSGNTIPNPNAGKPISSATYKKVKAPDKKLFINYGDIIPYCCKAIQELNEIVNQQKSQLDQQQVIIEKLLSSSSFKEFKS